jgi:signal transduction histidine kinase/CheY-like chemotaxis protein
MATNVLASARVLDAFSCAVIESEDTDELSRRLLEVFVSVAQPRFALLFVYEGDRLCLRAATGINDSAFAGFSLTDSADLEAALREANLLPSNGAQACRCIALQDGTTSVGVIVLPAPGEHETSDEVRRLLDLLTARAARAIVRQLAHETHKQAIEARDQVLAIVAHDLRNPINVISLAANMLLQRLPDSALRRPVERIVRGAQRADRLIQDLLEINAIEGGRFSIEKRPLETANLVLAALESQQALAANASIIFGTDLSPGLPPIDGDAERLLEVLENLIGNAVKFTGAGGSITVGAGRRDGNVLFWVKDTGAGVAADQLPYMFDRFWQARRTDRRGTGLGLTICRAIVEAHGGRIWPESRAGEGTTMYFSIPAAPLRVPRPSVREPERWNILLVDDRVENLIALKAILERPEYRLVTASTGEEALRLALRERFAVALVDIAMPGMNGLEVAVHLKELERSRDIPIIFITAFGDDPEEIHRAYSAGGADYLVKPLDAEIVRKKVAVFIDLTRKRHDSGTRGNDTSGDS